MDVYVNQIENLDFFVENGECEELIALDALDYIPTPKRFNILNLLVKKTAIGGKLTVGGIDVRGLMKYSQNEGVELSQLNGILFGSDLPKRSISHSEEVTNQLKSLNMSVDSISYNNLVYTIGATRNG